MTNNNDNQVPIATTAALMEKTRNNFSVTLNRHSPPKKKKKLSSYKSTFAHNPMVMAMITNNRLLSCQDVTKMMQECRKNGAANDQVCQTAAKYMESCLRH
jgi:hypothetical protein